MRRTILALVAGTALLAGCSDATAPRTLSVNVSNVTFTSDAERQAWPTTPTIEGGANIHIRGVAYVGCGGIRADAVERAGRIDVTVRAANPDAICTAVVAPNPAYELTISGLAPRSYTVRATVAGFRGAAEWVVEVFEVAALY